MAGPRHLGLGPRTVIATQIYCSEVLNDCPAETPDQANNIELIRTALSQVRRQPPSGPLDRNIHVAADRLIQIAHTCTDVAFGAELARRIERVRTSVRCDQCVAVSTAKRVCDDTASDAENVALPGACIVQLHELFELATNASRRRYRRYAGDRSLVEAVKVRFQTGPYEPGPHGALTSHRGVSGLTTNSTNSLVGSDVKLLIDSEVFDWSSYLATCYVLFHECFVHAWEDIQPARSSLTSGSSDDSFAEGWMDWLAIEVMERELKYLKARPRPRHPEQFLDAGRELHRARTPPPDLTWSPFNNPGAATRQMGQTAARGLLRFLRERRRFILPSDLNAWTAMLKLSVGLNVLAGAQPQRDQFVRITRQVVASRNANVRSEYGELLGEYFRDPDARRLLESSLAVQRRLLSDSQFI